MSPGSEPGNASSRRSSPVRYSGSSRRGLGEPWTPGGGSSAAASSRAWVLASSVEGGLSDTSSVSCWPTAPSAICCLSLANSASSASSLTFTSSPARRLTLISSSASSSTRTRAAASVCASAGDAAATSRLTKPIRRAHPRPETGASRRPDSAEDFANCALLFPGTRHRSDECVAD